MLFLRAPFNHPICMLSPRVLATSCSCHNHLVWQPSTPDKCADSLIVRHGEIRERRCRWDSKEKQDQDDGEE